MIEGRKYTAAAILSLISNLSGLLSIALIIWKGGVLWQMVVEHERRLNGIEIGGSVGLREHVKLDDERVRELKEHQDLDQRVRERLLIEVGDLSADVKIINAKLDNISERINSKPAPKPKSSP